MSAIEIFQTIFTIAAVIFVLIFIPVAFQLFATMKSINSVIRKFSHELTPTLNKLQIALDDLIKDLEHVDEILTTTTEVTHKVDRSLGIAQNLISSPILKFTSIAFAGLRTYLKFRKGKVRK